MKILLILILLLCPFFGAFAQNRHTVKAIVADSVSKQPLELVTVAVLNVADSSLVSYTLTGKDGIFTLRNINGNVPQRLLISYVGYSSLRIKLNFTGTETLNLGNLFMASKILNEVVIKGERIPIIIKKDTIEFNAEAFKTRPNAVVEDLLKKLPGVQVDHDGKITVNGKEVKKIKVDGKDFFANDPKIASRNLDADMISKVQVYDDREDDPDHLVPDYKVQKIINLKFKKELQKSTFGKVYGGGGTQNRYQAGGLFNRFVNDFQASAIVNSNNLSGTGVFDDGQPAAFGPSGGLQQVTTAGANFNDKLGKKVKVNLAYNFSGNSNHNLSVNNREQFLNDTTLTSNTSNFNHATSNIHSLYGTLDWTVDTSAKVKYAPRLNYMNNSSDNTSDGFSYNNFVPLLTKSTNSGNNNGSNWQYGHSLNYYRTFKRKRQSLSILNTVQLSPQASRLGYSASNLTSFIAGLNSDTLRRLANSTARSKSVDMNVAYLYPLSKRVTANLTATANYSVNGAGLFTYDMDPKTGLYSVFLQDQSSNLTRNQWQQTLHQALMYRYKDINIDAGFTLETEQINNQFSNNIADLNQHFVYLYPAINININKVSFNYTDNVQLPGINDLQPITIVYSQLSSFTGNPNLKPTRRHNFSLNYFNFNTQSMVNTFLSAQVTIEDNSITRERLVTAQGAELTTPVNRNGRQSVYIYGSIGKRFKKQNKWQIRENLNFNGSAGHNFFEVNHQDGYQDTYAITLTQQLAVNWNDVIDLSPNYTINPALTRYELLNYNNSSYVTQKLSVPLNVRWPKRISWDVNYTYIYNPLVAQGFQRKSNLLSLSFARALQTKDKGELRLTCYDLLNQSVSAYHFATENTINDIQNQSLKRYFLLTYTYKFNKTITKK